MQRLSYRQGHAGRRWRCWLWVRCPHHKRHAHHAKGGLRLLNRSRWRRCLNMPRQGRGPMPVVGLRAGARPCLLPHPLPGARDALAVALEPSAMSAASIRPVKRALAPCGHAEQGAMRPDVAEHPRCLWIGGVAAIVQARKALGFAGAGTPEPSSADRSWAACCQTAIAWRRWPHRILTAGLALGHDAGRLTSAELRGFYAHRSGERNRRSLQVGGRQGQAGARWHNHAPQRGPIQAFGASWGADQPAGHGPRGARVPWTRWRRLGCQPILRRTRGRRLGA